VTDIGSRGEASPGARSEGQSTSQTKDNGDNLRNLELASATPVARARRPDRALRHPRCDWVNAETRTGAALPLEGLNWSAVLCGTNGF
jgi:hypothetical protein